MFSHNHPLPSDCLLTIFQKNVKQYGERSAIIYNDIRLTYNAFNKKVNQLSHFLFQNYSNIFNHHAHPVIGVLGSNKLELLILQFAILKLGGTYVPFDMSDPKTRLNYTIQNSNIQLMLSAQDVNEDKDKDKLTGLLKHHAIEIINYKTHAATIADLADSDIYVSTDNHHPAYILYTSGSTAHQPKGVIQTRENIVGHIKNYTKDLNITSNDSFLQLAVFTHDQAIVDYFGALLNGCNLCLYDLPNLDVYDLHHFIIKNKVTIFSALPSIFFIIFESIDNQYFLPSLRIVVLGGEELKRQHVKLFKQTCPPTCLLINGYGATECSWVLFYVIDHKTDLSQLSTIPLGYATDNLKIILDMENAEDDSAELCINSDYLTPGYWQDSEATNNSLVSYNNECYYRTGDMVKKANNDCYFFVGRTHWHEKINGRRINLHEIETSLLNKFSLDDCVVMTYGEADQKKIYAFLSKKNRQLPLKLIIREALKSELPTHMIPFDYFILSTLPMLPNNKVDRAYLKNILKQEISPDAAIPFDGERSNSSHIVHKIWCETLNVKDITLNSNFIELGGNSFLAMKIVNRIKDYFEKHFQLILILTPKEIYQYPTFNLLNAYVLHARDDVLSKRRKSILDCSLPKAEYSSIINFDAGAEGILYYNQSYQSLVLNYEAMCVLANHFNDCYKINIKPTASHAELINVIESEITCSQGPSQIGLLLLQYDVKNAHPTPCVLHIKREKGEAMLMIADSIGMNKIEHRVLSKLKKIFPNLEIGMDLSIRQNDYDSCVIDAIFYLSEALRLAMPKKILITKKHPDYFEFISPPEVFKVTQCQVPTEINQDEILETDPFGRTLRGFLQEHTKECLYFPVPSEINNVKVFNCPCIYKRENTYMMTLGESFKKIIDGDTHSLQVKIPQQNYSPFLFKETKKAANQNANPMKMLN